MPPAGLDREARLAAALRENLRKRKAQARARADEDATRAGADGGVKRARAAGDGSAAGEPPADVGGGHPASIGDEAAQTDAATDDPPAKL